MCLYETKIKNIKYLPNKKNNGKPPILKDKRLATIKTACGWCSECRKKLANDWRVRLYEEIKANKNCYFVTLTFSPEAINKLENEMYIKKWHGLETQEGVIENDVNNLAAYAIRMWSERWRKHNKKAPKHWLITELGHNGSERIHLHGLIWGSAKDIEKTWQYGQIYIGQWVDNRTINYIVKYVTKLDEQHKGYKQRIFTSKGIGKSYTINNKNRHKYKGESTITYYKTHNGIELGLPRYYKEKLWSEEEREQLWINKINENKIYLGSEEIKTDKIKLEEWNNKLEQVRILNKKAGYGNNKTGNDKYIITELMKKKNNEIKDYRKDKLITKIKKRDIVKIEKIEGDEISKSNNTEKIYYGEYTGNTTQAQRDYNELLREANELQVSVRVLRLMKDNII